MKTIKSLIALFIVAVFASLACVSATAADKKPEKAEVKEKFRPFNGTIKAVDKTAMTITLEGEKAQMFSVAANAKISKDGKPAAFADLAAGDKVGGRAKETAPGKWMAVTINAGKRPAAKPAEKDKK